MKAFLVFVIFALEGPIKIATLRCRVCDHVRFTEECTTSIDCNPNEICYIAEVITDSLDVLYKGGCKSRTFCQYSNNIVGKRNDLIACTKCCESGDFCNHELCGMKTSGVTVMTSPAMVLPTSSSVVTSSSGQCYDCNDMNGGKVSDARNCRLLTSCQPGEMCYSEDFTNGGTTSYAFGCEHASICRELTKLSLLRKVECEDPKLHGSDLCSRRRSTEKSTCKICCGGNLCNLDTCEAVRDEIYVLYKQGKLDLYTLAKVPDFGQTTSA